MSVREIRLFGDPILKSVCDEVTDLSAAESLVQDLLDTTSLPGRAGVAANQIGVGQRVFAYSVDDELGYLINPEIIELAGEKLEIEEGCLSVPGLSPEPHCPSSEKSSRGLLVSRRSQRTHSTRFPIATSRPSSVSLAR